ncbi:TPA: hypothetical protein N2D99_002114 [Clostridium botulinum]|nr:hypothetical protein [Clostridium botulinum]
MLANHIKEKYIKCVSANDLEEHIRDGFWNPRIVKIGGKILGFKTVL